MKIYEESPENFCDEKSQSYASDVYQIEARYITVERLLLNIRYFQRGWILHGYIKETFGDDIIDDIFDESLKWVVRIDL